MTLFAMILTAVILAGCATGPRDTASGKVEQIAARPAAAARACVVQAMLAAGWNVRTDTQYQTIFSKRADPTLGIAARYGDIATVSFVTTPGGTKLISDVKMVMNLDTGRELPTNREPFRDVTAQVDTALAGCR